MLGELERKLTAVLADALATRPDLAVRQAFGDSDPPAAGAGIVRVALGEWLPLAGFDYEQWAIDRSTRRRVLPLSFTARLAFVRRPLGDDLAQRSAARALLLDDLARASHWLAAPTIRDGSDLRSAAADPGYAVQTFELTGGGANEDAGAGVLGGRLTCGGRATIWPPGPPEPEGVIEQLAVHSNALPLTLGAQPPQVPAGGNARLLIRGASAGRSLALSVASDLTPAQRGTIVSGLPGPEGDGRLHAVLGAETVAEYRAPLAADLGAIRQEVINVHLATPDGRRGLFLGAIVVRLRP